MTVTQKNTPVQAGGLHWNWGHEIIPDFKWISQPLGHWFYLGVSPFLVCLWHCTQKIKKKLKIWNQILGSLPALIGTCISIEVLKPLNTRETNKISRKHSAPWNVLILQHHRFPAGMSLIIINFPLQHCFHSLAGKSTTKPGSAVASGNKNMTLPLFTASFSKLNSGGNFTPCELHWLMRWYRVRG